MKNWMKTSSVYYAADPKRVYYVSLEFYMGRTLTNTMMALAITSETRKALYDCPIPHPQYLPHRHLSCTTHPLLISILSTYVSLLYDCPSPHLHPFHIGISLV